MPFVIATLGQKGGGGKSMVARLLAVELARQDLKVVVIDADAGQRTLVEWAEARTLNCLEPPIPVIVVDPEAEPDFRLAEVARDGTDYVIVDAPGWSDRMTVELGERADLCVIPTACSADDLRPTVRLFHELVADGVAGERIAIVLNRVRTAAEARFARDFLMEAGMTPNEAELPDQPTYRKGANGGQAASEVSHDGPRRDAQAVAAELIARAKMLGARAQQAGVEPKRFVATVKW
jgi:chromosome partitioning protein